MIQKLAILIVITIIFCVVIKSQEIPSQKQYREGDLWFEPIKTTVDGKVFEGELGRLIVRENRKNPNSNLIELAFVRLKSTAEKPGFPVVYLDGGPGSSAINLARIPAYMQFFQKLRETGDVILLDQRGVGMSKPNLTRVSKNSLPADVFANKETAVSVFKARAKEAADYFRSEGVDILAYNTIESANDIEDLRKALGVEKINLVGFSYGTHLGLAAMRYHGKHLNRVVLVGTEGPDHTRKLPSTSDKSIERLAELAAKDKKIGNKIPDLKETLQRVLKRLEKEPVTVTITDQRTKEPIDIKIGKAGLQFLIMRDLGDTNDLPMLPAWIYTMEKGDYTILQKIAERRYNQFGRGISIMTLVMDISSGVSKTRKMQIENESKTALLGDAVNFPISELDDVFGSPDLGEEYRSPIKTDVPTLFISGSLDNNSPPFQAEEVRKTFANSTHSIVENAGHESMLVNEKVQQTIVDYLKDLDVSEEKISLPSLEFQPITLAETGNSEAKSCIEDEHRQFDFWLGEWKIKQKILKADGKWFEANAETSVKTALDGCALVENWSGEVLFFWEGMKTPEVLKGLSVRAYNPKTKKWTINWMDTRGLEFGEHTGGFTDGKGEFFRTFKNPDGKEMTTRITFSDITKSSVHWDLAVSSNGGETWTRLWIMEMKRR